ncbi:MAG: YihY/virulence factor BrkB family protein [Bacteroidetes bacterium]|nr:YihY/virulence factor BrkB family protein [Bacteroidota bacterium]
MNAFSRTRFPEAVKYYALGLWNGLDEDHCFIFASGIAFNVLLCIIPLSLILFQVFSIIIQNDETAKQAVIQYIQKSLPIEQYGTVLQDWVQTQFSYFSNASLIPGIIAIVVLIWLASALFSSLRSAVNGIFHIKTRHNMALLKLKDIWMIFVVSFFLLVTVLINPLIGTLQKISDDLLPPIISGLVHNTVVTIIPIALMVVLFLYLYKTLPHQRIPWRVAALSTAITVVLVELMRYVFIFYLERISSLGAVYGTYAFIAVVALWAYYVALVFTIGALSGKLYYARIAAKH